MYLSIYLFCGTSSIFELDNNKNAAILRDFLNFSTWQHQKRSYYCLNLTTSKTKQFCETSFKNGKLSAELTASYQCVLRFFHSICLKCCACPERVMPGHTKCCTCHAKSSIAANLQIWCSKMQPLSGNQRPDLLTSLMNMSVALRLPRERHLCRSSANAPRLPSFLELRQNPHVLLTFGKVQNPLHLPRKITSEPSKVVRACGAFNILTWKCASRENRVHFFNISTSKSAPRPSVFNTFDFEMCFAPQRCALFRHLNFQKCSEPGFLYILTSKCASRHNGVQLFISHLTRCLCARRCSEPTFRPSGATNHWKNTVNRDFPTFSCTCIFFLLTLSLLWSSLFFSFVLWLFPPVLVHLSILSEDWLLNFLRP